MAIRILPQALVNQIAAGEVVERPASVVKELLENSLDAGATRIQVRIEGGGRERISITDNGRGIDADDLPLALAPHATSKITDAADLEAIASFGFRGEALSAIAAVADVSIASRTKGASEGWSVRSRYGVQEAHRPAAITAGTQLEVNGLFTNVPARRKFLRADPAEAARVTEVVINAAMAHPTVAVSLSSHDRSVIDLAPSGGRHDRVLEVFGESLGDRPIPVESVATLEDGCRVEVTGVVCRPEAMRGASRTQRLFVNGRPIVDRSLQHAVKESYRGLAEPTMQPRFVLFIEIDPRAVDVNVHPQKAEVRWRHGAAMHRVVHRAVQAALSHSGLAASGVSLLGAIDSRGWQGQPAARSTWNHEGATAVESTLLAARPFSEDKIDAVPEPSLLAASRGSPSFLQVDRTWIVFAEGSDLVIVDQHALHERVMFEEIRARIVRGDLASQRLLVGAHCAVTPEAIARLADLAGLFARLGIEARDAGPCSVVITAFPEFLLGRGVDPGGFVASALSSDEIAAALESSNSDAAREAALAPILDMMACKAAVKAGDRLSFEEVSRLLHSRDATDRWTNCPHGRPTAVRIPIADIERRFGRR